MNTPFGIGAYAILPPLLVFLCLAGFLAWYYLDRPQNQMRRELETLCRTLPIVLEEAHLGYEYSVSVLDNGHEAVVSLSPGLPCELRFTHHRDHISVAGDPGILRPMRSTFPHLVQLLSQPPESAHETTKAFPRLAYAG